jgi:hypothetical protein
VNDPALYRNSDSLVTSRALIADFKAPEEYVSVRVFTPTRRN